MNQERTSTSNHSAKSLANLAGGYRARYRAFLEQNKLPHPTQGASPFGQGLVNLAIFFALFVAILTVFGLGISWLNRPEPASAEQSMPSNQPPVTGASAGLLPSPPAQPAGHAEVRPQPESGKKRTANHNQ